MMLDSRIDYCTAIDRVEQKDIRVLDLGGCASPKSQQQRRRLLIESFHCKEHKC